MTNSVSLTPPTVMPKAAAACGAEPTPMAKGPGKAIGVGGVWKSPPSMMTPTWTPVPEPAVAVICAWRGTRRLTPSATELVAAAVALVDAGLFPRSTAGRCDYCDVNYACGTTAWTRARKREHELLEDLVSLQRHGPGEVSDDAGA